MIESPSLPQYASAVSSRIKSCSCPPPRITVPMAYSGSKGISRGISPRKTSRSVSQSGSFVSVSSAACSSSAFCIGLPMSIPSSSCGRTASGQAMIPGFLPNGSESREQSPPVWSLWLCESSTASASVRSIPIATAFFKNASEYPVSNRNFCPSSSIQ